MTRWTAALVLAIIVAFAAAGVAKEWIPLNDSPEPITFSWEVMTVPVAITGFKPTSVLIIPPPASKVMQE